VISVFVNVKCLNSRPAICMSDWVFNDYSRRMLKWVVAQKPKEFRARNLVSSFKSFRDVTIRILNPFIWQDKTSCCCYYIYDSLLLRPCVPNFYPNFQVGFRVGMSFPRFPKFEFDAIFSNFSESSEKLHFRNLKKTSVIYYEPLLFCLRFSIINLLNND